MGSPTVSFVVPCYKLGHLLRECVDSILSQSYCDFEILILDDCSPDDTPDVAGSFQDSRVTHIRNTENLGHLRNYNKGIAMSRGKYIWLISADDRLRTPRILELYVRTMDANPDVGFCCCPAMKLQDGLETGVEGVITHEATVFRSRDFLKILLKGNCIIAASGMVRKVCYDTCGTFPLDLPYAGDWFLWCLFALQYRVAYFAEPMVNYRAHELSMTNHLMTHQAAMTLKEGFIVLWQVRKRAQQLRVSNVDRLCEASLASLYAQHLTGGKHDHWMFHMTEAEFDSSLVEECSTEAEEQRMKARVWLALADKRLRANDFTTAAGFYKRALKHDRFMLNAWAKLLLLTMAARHGISLARGLRNLRKIAAR